MREALGCAPVPIYREPVQSPDGDLKQESPLGAHHRQPVHAHYHSEQRQSIEGAPSACLASAWFWRRSRADRHGSG